MIKNIYNGIIDGSVLLLLNFTNYRLLISILEKEKKRRRSVYNSFIFANTLILGYYLLKEFAARTQFPVTDIISSQADRFISR